MKIIVTLSDVIAIVACIPFLIFLIGVVVYTFIIKILEKIKRYRNKIKRKKSRT